MTLGCQTDSRREVMTLATTTSTQDSGLLDELLPVFMKQTSIEVKVVAVGSGQALELGRRGDADVLLTHSPAAEEKFMAEGNGEKRLHIMYNDFVLVGPSDDPAGVAKLGIVKAFSTIRGANAPFISRGDDSGTHAKEKMIWSKAKVEPTGDWYVSAGSGMAQILRMASEKKAYTLSDRATFLALQSELDLRVLSEKDALLSNPYSVILLSRTKHRQLNHSAAHRFAEFLQSTRGREVIRSFGVAKYGEPLYFVADSQDL